VAVAPCKHMGFRACHFVRFLMSYVRQDSYISDPYVGNDGYISGLYVREDVYLFHSPSTLSLHLSLSSAALIRHMLRLQGRAHLDGSCGISFPEFTNAMFVRFSKSWTEVAHEVGP
jgi:hypothetical protein